MSEEKLVEIGLEAVVIDKLFGPTCFAKLRIRLCGCARHAIRLDGDPYAQHREWSWSFAEGDKPNTSEALTRGRVSPVERAPGIGISAPEAEPLALDDPTGDDVARDAYRTTGGRTLDDVIDGCRRPHATGISIRLNMPAHAVSREALHRFEREALSAMERARKVSGGPVGVALEAPRPGVGYSFTMMPFESVPARIDQALARREAVATLQKIQEIFTAGLIEESEAIAWARGALGGEALPPTLDTLDRPQDEDAVLPELAE